MFDWLTDYTLGMISATLVLIFLIIAIVGIVIYLIGLVKLFKKAGQPGWCAIVPFYNDYVFTVKICGLHWAWYVGILASSLLLATSNYAASVLRLFVKGMCFYNLAIKCSKDPIPSMIFGALFPEVVTVVYGLNNSYYDNYIEVKPSGLF